MIRQQIKDVYFGMVRLLSLPNAWLAGLRYRRDAGKGTLRLHLGCGPHYLPGMINVDGNLRRRKDLWLDLRNRLPFPDGSASLIYCSHMLEHLFPDDALRLLGEMRRVLSDDGVARIAVPSLEFAVQIAAGKVDAGVSARFPRGFDAPAAQALNYLFCDGQHKYGYCWELLEAFARQAGFTRIANYSAAHGTIEKAYGPQTLGPDMPGSLVVELMR
jgi:predicted SAM-dependent methyltransferase